MRRSGSRCSLMNNSFFCVDDNIESTMDSLTVGGLTDDQIRAIERKKAVQARKSRYSQDTSIGTNHWDEEKTFDQKQALGRMKDLKQLVRWTAMSPMAKVTMHSLGVLLVLLTIIIVAVVTKSVGITIGASIASLTIYLLGVWAFTQYRRNKELQRILDKSNVSAARFNENHFTEEAYESAKSFLTDPKSISEDVASMRSRASQVIAPMRMQLPQMFRRN